MAKIIQSADLVVFPQNQVFKQETHLHVLPEWGSDHGENRLKIRLALREHLSFLGEDLSSSNILSLEALPTANRFGVSISHTIGLGGFLLVRDTPFCGLDLEPIGRVSTETWRRIKREQSANSLFADTQIDPTQGWTALEASYKCLSPTGYAKVLSDISVSKWDVIGSNLIEFEAKSIKALMAPQIRGLSFKHQNFYVSAVAIFP
jgi:hypothetical protein